MIFVKSLHWFVIETHGSKLSNMSFRCIIVRRNVSCDMAGVLKHFFVRKLGEISKLRCPVKSFGIF